ncbi:MAG TPA: acyl-CoA thioesterase [Candidatus Polarisedimenticolia bacterium]|nr:acyl-CoA thioesterase [Candidatus Polarisedimenticolia bacterium]
MSELPPGKSVDASRVEMTEIVLPEDTNQYGHVWGGRVMALIDKAAAIAAVRHSRTNVVTASLDSLTFRAPVRLGHILRLLASVNATFHTSMEVGVKVVSEDPLSGRQAHCCTAYVTLVALDAGGRPTSVPLLRASRREDRRRQREAARRRRARLARRDRKAGLR